MSPAWTMIDTHAHILPGLDDGAADLEEAVLMAKIAQRDGITGMVATPHTLNGVYVNTRRTVEQACEALNSELRGRGVDLEILPGCEAHFSPEVLGALGDGSLAFLGGAGRALLLELPMQIVPRLVVDFIHGLADRGILPVIAHPERNPVIQRDPGVLGDLVRAGAWSQITAKSVTGGFGRGLSRFCRDLVEEDLVHLVGSDAHWSDTRRPLLSGARDRLYDVGGEALVRELFEENVFSVLSIK
ncbi:MAG: tyrosine-protein phosphatase [Desulfatibacillaceae bacterium]